MGADGKGCDTFTSRAATDGAAPVSAPLLPARRPRPAAAHPLLLALQVDGTSASCSALSFEHIACSSSPPVLPPPSSRVAAATKLSHPQSPLASQAHPVCRRRRRRRDL